MKIVSQAIELGAIAIAVDKVTVVEQAFTSNYFL